MLKLFKQRFWQPPRPHGEIIEDRTVSFVELFYDLVYVVLIARAAHTLAHHVTWRGVAEFAVIFGMIWLAWLNGTLYHELHGREDGRSRTYIFIQMLLLAGLAVYAGDATGEGGTAFAGIYLALLLVFTWLWYSVRRQDTEEYMDLTARYLSGMVISSIVIATSIFLPDEVRLYVWAAFGVGWLIGPVLIAASLESGATFGVRATDSMVERFGLFTIIVLGEVVVGVVDGLSGVERDLPAVATGIVGLTIGFGIWWTYFDFAGRRLPRDTPGGFLLWMYSHLPIAMAIAASGAAMVSLIEHAGDERAPAATAWLLTGSIAVVLVVLVFTMRSLRDFERLPRVYQPLSIALTGGAAVALLVGWLRPVPWSLVLMVAAILSGVWLFAVDRWLRQAGGDGTSSDPS
jgi:low temperature requirement protein LtrA